MEPEDWPDSGRWGTGGAPEAREQKENLIAHPLNQIL